MFHYDLRQAQQRLEQARREVAMDRLARELGERSFVEVVIRRMATLLSAVRLPARVQPEETVTQPRLA